MTEPNLRWCDFYCFALWLHLGPCHVSIQFVFVCIFGRKRFSTAIQWLPECVCVYDCIIILPKRVCVCVMLKLEHIPFSHRIWSKLYLELNLSKHRTHSCTQTRTHFRNLYARKKGDRKGHISICHITQSVMCFLHYFILSDFGFFGHHQII